MQSVMKAIRAAYEAKLFDAAQELEPSIDRETVILDEMDRSQEYHDYCVEWLNRTMGHDQVIVSADRQQFLLTDKAGSGDLPNSHAIHAIGDPIRRGSVDPSTVQVNNG